MERQTTSRDGKTNVLLMKFASTEPVMPKDGGEWVATPQSAEEATNVQCPVCGLWAKSETGLKAHMRFKHKGE